MIGLACIRNPIMRRIKMEDDFDYVSCRICGWKGRQINAAHLWIVHQMKVKEYKEKFPDAPITCEFSKRKMQRAQKKSARENPERLKAHSEKIKQFWKIPENRAMLIEKMADRDPPTDECKEKIRQSMKRVYQEGHVLKSLNADQIGDKNPFYGKKHSQTSKNTMSEKATKRLKQEYANGRESAFKYLGLHNKKTSTYEAHINQYLSTLGFIKDLLVPFNKGAYYIDFALKSKMLAIEIDSKLHDKTKERDEKKDKFLQSKGWKVVRVRFDKETPEEVLSMVKEVLNENQINHKEKE